MTEVARKQHELEQTLEEKDVELHDTRIALEHKKRKLQTRNYRHLAKRTRNTQEAASQSSGAVVKAESNSSAAAERNSSATAARSSWSLASLWSKLRGGSNIDVEGVVKQEEN